MTKEEEFIVEDLEKLAKKYTDPNFQIVINALQGAILSDQSGILAKRVQDIVIDVLLPNAQKGKENYEASKN